ncbi:hypothetical protein FOQG_14631 [Fusarium oxysporum f. sp. raphani 54005]|uniref:Uncharacterized protein n=2 Tax=Fusarium oxysporum TaxID=5507 RepID=X0BQV1_FUSOX|nr:hypothetical protein FOMG_17113 [Fusarium oxysporum f. sp. melonis 26406]EXK80859.1 hypothetical protein FOQG_14631 [Fusarium oxysporum f. sp. raphani 54005]
MHNEEDLAFDKIFDNFGKTCVSGNVNSVNFVVVIRDQERCRDLKVRGDTSKIDFFAEVTSSLQDGLKDIQNVSRVATTADGSPESQIFSSNIMFVKEREEDFMKLCATF